MFEISLHPVKDEVRQRAHLDNEAYQRLYRQSIEQPDAFWSEQARQFLHWFKPWDRVQHSDLTQGEAQWFAGGQLSKHADRRLRDRKGRNSGLRLVDPHRRLPRVSPKPAGDLGVRQRCEQGSRPCDRRGRPYARADYRRAG